MQIKSEKQLFDLKKLSIIFERSPLLNNYKIQLLIISRYSFGNSFSQFLLDIYKNFQALTITIFQGAM